MKKISKNNEKLSYIFLAGMKRRALQVGWSRDGVENEIEHNSLNFRATSPKFCMQVDLDRPQPFPNKKNVKNVKITKSTITRSIFELEARNFACK